MADRAIKCKKCKKKIFYIPDDYSMNIKVICTNCHDHKTRSKSRQTAAASYSKMKRGKRPDIHPTYSFRSATEINFARILNHLGLEWKYEERVFTFPDRKIRPFIYIMDFEITKGDSNFPEGFWEIKGRMKPEDRNKLRLLKKHYPEEFAITWVVIYSRFKKKDIAFCEKLGCNFLFYDQLTKKYKGKIKYWE